MTENKDVYQKAKDQLRLSERIEAEIPGFRGYKEKELRRESDRLIRNHLYRKLSEAKNHLRTVFQKIADERLFDVASDLDRLTAKFDRITEKVNHASYGYTGFFDVIKVREENLDKMINFDNALLDDVDNIGDQVNALKAIVSKKEYETAKEHVANLTDAVEAFDEALDQREEAMLGAP